MNLEIFIFAVLSNLILLFIFSLFAKKFKLIDSSSFVNNYISESYLIGGISIYITVLFSLFFFEVENIIIYLIFTSSIIVFIGIIDDIFNITYLIRFFIQIICALIIIGLGILINDLGLVLDNSLIQLGMFSFVITVLSIVGLTNAINFIDGVDGLASCVVLIGFLSIFCFSFLQKNTLSQSDINILIVISSSIFVFIFFNLFKILSNKVFLGDAGSTFLGFMLSCLLIYFSQDPNRVIHPVLCIWCVTIPVYDVISVIIIRSINKKNPFKPDKNHIHHLLQKRNFSNVNLLIIILSFGLIMSIVGFSAFILYGPWISLILYIILFIPYFMFTNFLKI